MVLDSVENKERILTEFLKIVAFDGWSKEAVLKAVSDCGIEKKFAGMIFENFQLDLAEFYIESQNKKAAEKISAIENFHQKKIRDKIRLSLYQRFAVEEKNKIALQRLINFYLSPKNFTDFQIGANPLFQGMKACYKISDFIWKNIHDQSTDFNFYTKRLTLAKIILRSLFVFVKDDSENFTKTENFINFQIEKVMKFERRKAEFKKFSSSAKTVLCEVFLDDEGSLKSPEKFVRNLPFFRLF